MGELTRAALCVCECVACCLLFSIVIISVVYGGLTPYIEDIGCMHFFQHPALVIDAV